MVAPALTTVSKQEGQRSLGYDEAYIARFVPTWNSPTFSADAWRRVVASQPFAIVFRETLISNLLSLDWKITVRDSALQDEMAGTVKHYTRLFEKAGYGMDLDWTSHVEWIAADLLDTPFGGASEIGRKEDKPNGRVQWIKPLDSANLYPTMNFDYPVVETYLGKVVAFPKHSIVRTFMTPVKKIERQGWGTPPPELIYMAMNMLSQGDSYYANLLLDIPSAGILDLGDMEANSALEWVAAYKSMLMSGGNTAFRIPVLYEHNTDVKFIPFGKVPNDIMYDRITLRYASIVGAGYGMTLSDIGLSPSTTGGDTLAGSIRSDRKTRKTGFARAKKKLKYYFDQILPPQLQFHWIDYDDELNVALGRARLANATAWGQYIENGIFTAQEARLQTVADGLVTISINESIEKPYVPQTEEGKAPERPGMLGNPVSPSQGGYGEIKMALPSKAKVHKFVADVGKQLKPLFAQLSETYTDQDDLYIPSVAVKRSIEGKKGFDFKTMLHGVKSLGNDVVDDLVKKAVVLGISGQLFDDSLDADMFGDYDEIVNSIKDEVYKSLQDFLGEENGNQASAT